MAEHSPSKSIFSAFFFCTSRPFRFASRGYGLIILHGRDRFANPNCMVRPDHRW